MKIKVLFVAVFAVFASLILTSCSCCKKENASQDYKQILQYSWQLDFQSMKDWYDNTLTTPKSTRACTLTLLPEEVFGQSFVNHYFGPVKLDTAKGSLQFGQLGATRMAGPDMNNEQQYFIMLSKVTSYTIQDGQLILYGTDENGKSKKFAKFTRIPLIKR